MRPFLTQYVEMRIQTWIVHKPGADSDALRQVSLRRRRSSWCGRRKLNHQRALLCVRAHQGTRRRRGSALVIMSFRVHGFEQLLRLST